MRVPLLLAAFVAVVLAAYRPATPPPATDRAAADSTGWVNLQVLPDSLSRDELMALMRGFTDALGVRCSFCHVRDSDDWDFPSDSLAHKEVARGMMRMTRQINHEILPAIDGMERQATAHVTCWTCHQGATHPETAPPTDE